MDPVLEQVSWHCSESQPPEKEGQVSSLGLDSWMQLGGVVLHRNGCAQEKHNRKSVGRSRGPKGLSLILGLCPPLAMPSNTAGGRHQLSSFRPAHCPLAKLGEGLIPCWSIEHGNIMLKRYPWMLGSTIQKPASENGDRHNMMPQFSFLNMSCKMNRCDNVEHLGSMPEYLKIALTQVQIIAKKPKSKLNGRLSCITQKDIIHHTSCPLACILYHISLQPLAAILYPVTCSSRYSRVWLDTQLMMR